MPPLPRHRQPGDGWVECACGQRHWGLFGAAGLLLAGHDPRASGPSDAPEGARATHVVLQHRATWSHHGGTWGIPGGARAPHESAVDAALRESGEEAGIAPASVRVLETSVLDHGTWSYTTVLAEVAPGARVDPRPTDAESLDVRWVALDDVARLPLLPAFGAAWPVLRRRLVGTPRPDGHRARD
ncbi:NUDIX hydrolase [Cellulomonas sp. PhB143]|uniref:NUDIX hydrolase n=1 Tax=Cellulomonas sp. PhB143 TaxID=2485186 RepID=UPI000F48220E|nr:NUDIX hydrolase [Cellulomonas sp. PhB143]ROS76969.1 ADP-ribose pyrophosphatase YjhB (NUDIX family) [Cellulomonas sp. PhB143]